MIYTPALVKEYPTEPQASVGLHKCMDILHRMQSIWPSAWRAYQLLQGSKVQSQDPRVSVSPGGTDRRKRSAENPLEQPQFPESLYRHPPTYARLPPSSHPPSHAQPGYIALDMPSPEPQYFSEFDRWGPSAAAGMHNYASGTLSTSVLPQQFSTGFVDERVHRSQERTAQRFPQYWNDYSALGQMDATYNVPPNGMVPTDAGSSTGRSAQQAVVYPQDQFLVFSAFFH